MANNIDFVIGGKNNVAPAFNAAAKSLNRLEVAAVNASSAAARAASNAGVTIRNLAKIAIPLSAAAIAMKGFRLGFRGVQASVEAFQQNNPGSKKASLMATAFEGAGKSLDKLATTVGEILAPALTMGADALSWLADKATEVLQPAIQWITEFIVKAFTIIEVVFKNFGTVVELAITSALLQFERIKNTIVDIFTRVLPEYFYYFGELIVAIFKNAFEAALTVLSNFGQKMTDGLLAVFEFIRGGMKGGLTGLAEQISTAISGSLMAGFEGTKLPSLPQLLERQLSEREVALGQKVTGLAAGLVSQFNEKFDARMKAFNGKDVKAQAQFSVAQVTEARLLTRGPGSNIQDKIEENTRKTAEATIRTAARQAEMESALRQLQEAYENQDTLKVRSAPS